jgi:hypothetical protein
MARTTAGPRTAKGTRTIISARAVRWGTDLIVPPPPDDTTPPTYLSGVVGSIDEYTVVIVFDEYIVGTNYATGVTIKKGGATQTIVSATRQADHNVVRYVLSAAIISTDTVTWEYSAATGNITDIAGNVLGNVSAQTVTNATASHYVAKTGADNAAGTLAAPWLTIGHALTTMTAGEVCLVLAGNYAEQVTMAGSNLTLLANGDVITQALLISGDYNTINGFEITDPASDYAIMTTGNHNLVEDCETHETNQDAVRFFGSYNTFRGLYIHDILADGAAATHTDCFQTWGWNWGATNIIIENCWCYNNETVNTNNEFMYIESQTLHEVRDITIRNNVFIIDRPIWAGIGVSGTYRTPNIFIYNNVFYNIGVINSTDACVFNASEDNVKFINNLCINWGSVDAWRHYVELAGCTNLLVRNNFAYNNYGHAVYGTPYPGDIWNTDPKVVSIASMDFHPQSDSPLINAGYDLTGYVDTDIDGVSRPVGAGFDIGVYEYH